MILIAQWCQPSLNIQEESVTVTLDQLAEKIRLQLPEQLRNQLPGTVTKQLDDWTTTLDTATCRAVLNAANTVFQLEGFAGNGEDYYAPENSYINRVLETRLGIPITLSLLYACVVARLGVRCEPVNFPSHFLLRWMERPEASTEQGKVTIQ